MSVIIGAKTIEQLDDNLAAAKLKLSAEEVAALDQASALTPEYPGWMLERQGAAAPAGAAKPEGLFSRKREKGIRGEGRDDAESLLGRVRRRQDRRREGDPGDAARRGLAHRRDRLARSRQGAGRGRRARHRQAYGSYEELLADPEIEAIYNPLPNELHVPWTRARAGGRQACALREADRARRRRGASD